MIEPYPKPKDRIAASKWAAGVLAERHRLGFIDTETTGLGPRDDPRCRSESPRCSGGSSSHRLKRSQQSQYPEQPISCHAQPHRRHPRPR